MTYRGWCWFHGVILTAFIWVSQVKGVGYPRDTQRKQESRIMTVSSPLQRIRVKLKFDRWSLVAIRGFEPPFPLTE